MSRPLVFSRPHSVTDITHNPTIYIAAGGADVKQYRESKKLIYNSVAL